MRPLSRVRFDALAGYARQPMADYFSEELSWFEHGSERVLGVVLRDRTDDDFTGMVMARDRRGRFRAVDFTSFAPTRRRAQALLRRDMKRLAMAPDAEYYQGDEVGVPLDFFTPRVDRRRLNPNFVVLTEQPAYSPAFGIITPMMHWYEDPDGNFIEQFQTTGFDARLWELYLFAAFSEMGYRIDRIHAVPDFACEGLGGAFAVEAMTVNPTRDATGAIVPPPPHADRTAGGGRCNRRPAREPMGGCASSFPARTRFATIAATLRSAARGRPELEQLGPPFAVFAKGALLAQREPSVRQAGGRRRSISVGSRTARTTPA